MKKFISTIIRTKIYTICLIILVTLIRSIILLLPPLILKYSLSNIIFQKSINNLLIAAIIIGIIPLITNYFISIDLKLSSYVFGNMEQIIYKISKKTLKLENYKNIKGEIHIYSKETSNVASFFYRNIGNFLWVISTIIIGFIFIIWENALLGFILFLTLFLFSIYLYFNYKLYLKMEKINNKLSVNYYYKTSWMDRANLQITLNQKLKKYISSNIEKLSKKIYLFQKRLSIFDQRVETIIQFINNFVIIEIFIIGFLLINISNVGTLVSIYQIILWIIPAIALLNQLFMQSIIIYPQMKNISDLYDKNNHTKENINNIVQVDNNHIIINKGNVGSYTIFKKFIMQKGNIYNLVGDVGIGKTTFLSAMTKHISYNEIPFWISYVKPVIFTDTIFNNIVMSQNIENKELIRILKLYDFPEKFIENLNRNIDVFKLSGGEKQLINFARCIIRASKLDLFIFDESFSAIDNISFKKIWIKFRMFNKSKTIMIVSHNHLKSVNPKGTFYFFNYIEKI
ncbi:ATP-binding cassette domain-containing protein [Apilactobacillus micheneri]|uniref:ATP-binding cassette domain-containing protein n=1 Tax=Apilactobacillus micheneri TaxID=1899430 RepID=UPI000D512E1D|nr:ABC transporter ATP-binding protein [Apilactobacillus micheneri]GAY79813.1 lipid A export ATP-binding/permease protein MsbA [Apilactobacillus micheneri]